MATASALAKANKNLREKGRALEREIEGVVVSNGAAAALGYFERAGMVPVAIGKEGNIPVKPLIAGGAYLVGAMAGGGFGRVCKHIATAASIAYAYNAAKTRGLVAG